VQSGNHMSNGYLRQMGFGETVSLVECTRLIEGHLVKSTTRVAVEKELFIYLNEEHIATASITPGMEREFVFGYLLGQGFIAKTQEIESIEIAGNTAKLIVEDAKKMFQRTGESKHLVVSGGGKSAVLYGLCLPRIKSEVRITKEAIFKAMNMVLKKAELYKATSGVHAAGLFTPEATPVCIIEDIGRHNTLDKVIGYALVNEIDLSMTFLASTGRMTSEMIGKICQANIPVAATKTAVTDLGLKIGEMCGLTIAGFVRDKGVKINTDMGVRFVQEREMKIYTNAERILSRDR